MDKISCSCGEYLQTLGRTTFKIDQLRSFIVGFNEPKYLELFEFYFDIYIYISKRESSCVGPTTNIFHRSADLTLLIT